ncbi:MAG: glycosyltransferase family 2 protein [Acidobacteriota bacterium]|nr:glycosyltransferase family 2 protein [Acidobacteriota bacterium]
MLTLSVIGLVYIYAGYPLLVALIARCRPRPVRKGDRLPDVTILIAAHNEAESIEATIRNKLELDYPPEKLQVRVISDGSTDGTDEIVRGLSSSRVRLIRQESRGGKTLALNRGIVETDSEIVVFADANSLHAPDALRALVANFVDPEVGYVTGKMIYTDESGSPVGDGCSAYMRYENLLRRLETQAGSIVGVDGGVDAIRRGLYEPMREDQLPDFVLPLKVTAAGYRVVFEPEALLREPSLDRAGDEYRMRVRVSLRALWALHDMRRLLNPFRHGLFAWQLFSHKVLRYAAFLFLSVALLANSMLWDAGLFWRVVLVAQIAAYVAALCSWLLERIGKRIRLFYLPHYFTLINLAAAHAFFKYLLGRKQVLWTPRKG